MKKNSPMKQIKKGIKDGIVEVFEEDAPAITGYARQIKDIVSNKKKKKQ